jgi:hypothetical protein
MLVPFFAWILLVPVYVVLGAYAKGRALHMPELSLDRALPVVRSWTLVYGSLYPTVLLRPASGAIGGGFFAWTLRIAYTWDAPYNCFPSLHAHNPSWLP